ncbi:MAG: aminopeptidase, partial [Chlamydiia bacterium]|nr:aminopeptidase [Chlamydiia bacterium]
NCCGKINFPDGEIYTGPNLNVPDGGVNGRVCGSLPTLFRNQRAEGIALTFENGKVIEATADVGEDYLHAMLDLDEGAKRVGEVAIGTNNAVIYPTKSILYDEKMGGTFHIALGRGYPQTGNTNASALHWDMIFDLRNGGTIHADGELFYRDGEWLIDQ